MTPLLYIDIESTGLNPSFHDVIQIGCVPIIDDIECQEFNQFCQPVNYSNIEQGAIDAHGISIEKMKTFQLQSKMLDSFISYLSSFNTRFTISGYNVNFDRKFIGALFQRHGKNEDYRRLFSNNVHDVMVRAKVLKSEGKVSSCKLGVIAEYLGVSLINAHDALADIKATIEIDVKLSSLLGEDTLDKKTKYVLPDFNVPEVPALHIHSEYSVLDSATTSASWYAWAQKNEVSAVAFPDHVYASSLYGSINPPKAKDGSLKYPAITCVPAISLWIKDEDMLYQLTAWATSNTGYKNIVKLASIGWNTPIDLDGDSTAGCITLQQLQQYKEDISFGTSCDQGLLSQLLDSKKTVEKISEYVNSLSLSLGSLYLELLPLDIQKRFDKAHGLTAYSTPEAVKFQNRSKAINNLAWILQGESLKLIISSIAHFIDEEDKIVQDCKMKNSFKDERFYWESRHQRSSKEQYAILASHIDNFNIDSWNLCRVNAEEIVNKAKSIKIKHEYHMPKIDIPKEIEEKTNDYDKQLYYAMMLKIKEHKRWIDDPVYVARFKKEIDVIWKNTAMNFIPYFMLYEDISSHARECGILQGLARGSAGGCLISYYLKITHLDPVKCELPFERFLSHARINASSWPDIDSDFGQRHQVLKYLKEKYKLGFAQIGTFQKMKVKSAIKHAMFALYGRPSNDLEIRELCDSIPDSPQGLDEYKFIYGYTDSEDVAHKGVIDSSPYLLNFFKQYSDCEKLVNKLLGLPASLGRHPSAFVISTLDLADGRVPTFITQDKDLGDVQAVQFDGNMCEKSGLVKADILGVSTIQTISDCVSRIKENHGVDLLEENEAGVALIYRLPEDTEVFADFYDRKTDSSFQFNTDLIKSMVRDFAPQSIKQLADMTALARPGTLDLMLENGVSATQQYLDVRNGRSEATYVHPDVKEILLDTYGVCCYQENLMSLLVKFAGYSLEESDQIRSAIAKKKRDVMTKAFEKIREETAKVGWSPEQAQGLCDILTAYSNYAFNRSHSFAYAQLGYITMWLKNKYPLEWWASELNMSGEDKLRKYMGVIGKMVTPPSLKEPSASWEIIDGKIAAPLTSVKGIGIKPVVELMENAPYESIQELIQTNTSRVFHVGVFAACLKARATDCFIDLTQPYASEKQKIVDLYFQLRGRDPRKNDLKYFSKTAKTNKIKEVDPIYTEEDPFKLYLMEKDVSKIFSKSLLDDKYIRKSVEAFIPNLKVTGKKAIPYTLGKSDPTPVVRSIDSMENIIKSTSSDGHTFYGIFLFQGSTASKGVSKKSNKEWKKLEVELSDGVRSIFCTIWDCTKPLRWPVNTPILVFGKIKSDWKGKPTFDIKNLRDIVKIENIMEG